MIHRCPGQHPRSWKPKDVFEVVCPSCGARIEFFKDDTCRACPACGATCTNPNLNLGCLEWCRFADQCRPLMAGQPRTEHGERTTENGNEKKHHHH